MNDQVTLTKAEQDEKDRELGQAMPLIAQLMEHSMKETQGVVKLVEDNLRADVVMWKKRYADLFESVDKAASVVTSRALESVLDYNHAYLGQAKRPEFWEKDAPQY